MRRLRTPIFLRRRQERSLHSEFHADLTLNQLSRISKRTGASARVSGAYNDTTIFQVRFSFTSRNIPTTSLPPSSTPPHFPELPKSNFRVPGHTVHLDLGLYLAASSMRSPGHVPELVYYPIAGRHGLAETGFRDFSAIPFSYNLPRSGTASKHSELTTCTSPLWPSTTNVNYPFHIDSATQLRPWYDRGLTSVTLLTSSISSVRLKYPFNTRIASDDHSFPPATHANTTNPPLEADILHFRIAVTKFTSRPVTSKTAFPHE
ncbi:hypothetical protein DFP72DRAFT_1082855 [Ephemerocybe angulata]|uniref:Uncharacterized protein n=1 Tax=Ephemerocybe angulata TaxID=980116 RepID=A0A8H6LTU5_9AGAR|nr:hypothetical protein DFP72DRAFT_1082855 [Tulosesus angulatus]